MKKIYEAIGKEKEEIIDAYNEMNAFDRAMFNRDEIGLADMVMLARTDRLPLDGIVDATWSINGITGENDTTNDIIIFEPLEEQIDKGIEKISSTYTSFKSPIQISKKAIILMPLNKYEKLCENEIIKSKTKKMNLRFYEGNEGLAIKMLMSDRGYTYLPLSKDGYANTIPDMNKYIEIISNKIEELNKNKLEEYDENYQNKDTDQEEEITEEKPTDYGIITGLTKDKEGSISIDDKLYASTDIGKLREKQEDAVLLIKDHEIPGFKMMVVADGMGGLLKGEIASDIIVNNLKNWFETLTNEQKQAYYTSVEKLKNSLLQRIENDIQKLIEAKTWKHGGSTLACAIIGQKDTLIANIGDSRIYVFKDKEMLQLSREDTVAQRKYERGEIPSKEVMRFDTESNILVQCLGMDGRKTNTATFTNN